MGVKKILVWALRFLKHGGHGGRRGNESQVR